jgi:hypothetical protein
MVVVNMELVRCTVKGAWHLAIGVGRGESKTLLPLLRYSTKCGRALYETSFAPVVAALDSQTLPTSEGDVTCLMASPKKQLLEANSILCSMAKARDTGIGHSGEWGRPLWRLG